MLKALLALDAIPGPTVHISSDKPVKGYCQTLGVTAKGPDELLALVRNYIKEDLGSTLVEVYEMWVPDFSGRDRDIAELCGDIERPGVWYASGRAWYWNDESDQSRENEGQST